MVVPKIKEQTVKSLANAILSFEKMKFSRDKISKSVNKFSEEKFDKKLRDFIKKCEKKNAKEA